MKADNAAKVASLEDTISNVAHQITLLQRRLYGNRTERSGTTELQLTLGDLLAGEQPLQRDLAAAVGDAQTAIEPPDDPSKSPSTKPRRRRDLLASKLALPRYFVEILDEELEEQGCRRIGFEDSAQLMFRRGDPR